MRFTIFILLFTISTLCFGDSADAIQPKYQWLSIVPPIITIVLALILREVLVSLVVGILVGLIIIAAPQYGFNSVGHGFLEVPLLIKASLFNEDHLAVILFTFFIGAMVSIIGKNGGMMALVRLISSKARSARSAQLSTWGLGLAIFFDDYANTLVVGKTMRPLTDKLKVSREKLAYLVDSTAAPVASIAFITTWIGAELGYIKDGIGKIENGAELIGSPYSVFFQSLEYSFYPILTIAFMFLLIWKKKDFGPMFTAEVKARNKPTENNLKKDDTVGDIDEVESSHEYLLSALLPIGVMLFGALIALLSTGYQEIGWNPTISFVKNLSGLIGAANSYTSLIWASFGGLATAVLVTVIPRSLSLIKTVEHAVEGVKMMLPAILILTLAWTLSEVTSQLHTAEYLSHLVDGKLSPHLLPTVVFLLSAVIAFSTGTSWGTMSILYPIVLVMSWKLCVDAGLSPEMSTIIFANVVSSVLAGSVLGDHCSPISDTTILSSLASECDHIEHVRTQLPYALTVGAVSVILGTIPAGYGLPFYITFPLCLVSLTLIVSYFGKMVPNGPVNT